MTLSKELTNHSLPEIGDAFGGRDHTTVLHACKQINKLRHSSMDIRKTTITFYAHFRPNKTLKNKGLIWKCNFR